MYIIYFSEPERTILLAEKGSFLKDGSCEEHNIVAEESFQFIGTMNPGGDYGKKELSPALRNRFTEIWVETGHSRHDDFQLIIEHNLILKPDTLKRPLAQKIIRFLKWFQSSDFGKRQTVSVRDVLTWVRFMNVTKLTPIESCIHGCFLTFLDGLGSGNSFITPEELNKFKSSCIKFWEAEATDIMQDENEKVILTEIMTPRGKFLVEGTSVGIDPFFITQGELT